LLPEIERQQKLGREVVVRADAAFAKPEIYAALEERDVKYAIRIPANDSLKRDIAELLILSCFHRDTNVCSFPRLLGGGSDATTSIFSERFGGTLRAGLAGSPEQG
jgi:hypothetical protein